MDEFSSDGGSKYQLLNQMLAGFSLSRDSVLEDAMGQYLTRQRLAETMFELID